MRIKLTASLAILRANLFHDAVDVVLDGEFGRILCPRRPYDYYNSAATDNGGPNRSLV
jgi:hypothetical protein